jgi:hypothetical protein
MSGDFDWPEHAKEELDRIKPEAVVFIIGTNDAIVYDDAQEEKYRLLTDQMMQLLIGDEGRDVYWVNAPVMAEEDLEENILEVDRIQREVAEKYADNVTFVDAHTLFADEQGEYQSSIEDEDGDTKYLRAGDGIHLSGDGAEYLAEHVYGLLDAEWKISQQAVPGQTKKVIVTKGSTQVPGSGSSSRSSGSSSWRGSSSGGSSSGSSSGGTSNTTAGTTATTAPPATTPTTSPPVTSPPPSSTPPDTTP